MDTCKTCKFFTTGDIIPGSLQRQTTCNRNPPYPIPMQTAQGVGIMSAFPPVQPDWYCGGHSPRLIAKN